MSKVLNRRKIGTPGRCNEQPHYIEGNEQELPKNIRLQMFRNSFSTKGKGRGLGTHSMKLIGERYLGGKVGFWSDSESGTVFYLDVPISSNIEPQEAVGASSAAN
ncbi:hypothetical protein [Paucidesulfovibrio gracilis]|uniref:hypothetical protein n=1 Tax=Paucidesulfovibrio gracilis TaxID=47158 RepID=UPI000999FE04|nr:hypothetical protein [Paucidesulfovibrio gracilis]